MKLFDAGKLIESGGYAWPLQQWAAYYHMNVERIGAIKPERFALEFPEADKALKGMAERAKIVESLLSNEVAMTALIRVVEHLQEGKAVELLEGDGTVGEHAHAYSIDANGNGETDVVNGHKHMCEGGKCMPADGHEHDMPAPEAAKADAPAPAKKEGE